MDSIYLRVEFRSKFYEVISLSGNLRVESGYNFSERSLLTKCKKKYKQNVIFYSEIIKIRIMKKILIT